eukprot:258764_1
MSYSTHKQVNSINYNKNKSQLPTHNKQNNYNRNNNRNKRRKSASKSVNVKCGICNINDRKYKCPNCIVMRYCSVACYKKHKENKECIKPTKTLKYDKNEPVSVTGYTVSQKQFELLENDDQIKQKLMNKRLREIIESIDDSKRPQNKLESIMSNDKQFAQFVNYMLNVIGFRPNVYSEDNQNLQNTLDKYYEQDINLDSMNGNEKFKYLMRKMLIKHGV